MRPHGWHGIRGHLAHERLGRVCGRDPGRRSGSLRGKAVLHAVDEELEERVRPDSPGAPEEPGLPGPLDGGEDLRRAHAQSRREPLERWRQARSSSDEVQEHKNILWFHLDMRYSFAILKLRISTRNIIDNI